MEHRSELVEQDVAIILSQVNLNKHPAGKAETLHFHGQYCMEFRVCWFPLSSSMVWFVDI